MAAKKRKRRVKKTAGKGGALALRGKVKAVLAKHKAEGDSLQKLAAALK